MKYLKRLTAVAVLLTMLVGLTACGTEEPDKEGDGSEEKELKEITFVLDWTPNTNHTGLYAAIANGYFEEAGLKVNVVQPPEDGAEMLVGSGKAQFGVSFQDYIAPALVGEQPVPITAVAAILQHNTSGILSRKGEGIDRPKGLEGKMYATWDLPVEQATLRQVMTTDGGDFEKVQMIPSTVTDEVSALQSKSVDAIWVFYGWGGVACEVAGLETDYFSFEEIDPVFDFYTPVIIANDTFLEEEPETAKAFLAALSKGYAYAVENPEAAADILMEAAPELKDSKDLVYASQKYLADQYVADAARWGEFDESRWSGFYAWLNENELLEEPVEPTAGFTNEYLPEA